MQEFSRGVKHISLAALLAALASGCGGGGDGGGSGAGLGIVGSSGSSLPQLSGATPAVLSGTCAELTAKISFEKTTITDAKAIDAGTLTVAGTPVPAHCQVTGSMFQRTSPVDGKSYAIKFEMRQQARQLWIARPRKPVTLLCEQIVPLQLVYERVIPWRHKRRHLV